MEPPREAGGSSWKVDETYIRTRPGMGYLYRAVDRQGKTVESLFQTTRRIAAAMAFSRKAVTSSTPRWPRKITLDGTSRVIGRCAGSIEKIGGGYTS